MKTFVIMAGILLLFWLIGLIRIGGLAEYSEDGITVRLRIGRFWRTVYPAEPKPAKQEKRKEKKEKPKTSANDGKKKGGTVKLLLKLLPVAVELAGKLLRKIRIDLLTIHLIWADRDPAKTATGYGAAHAAVGMIYPIFDHNFRIKDRDIRIDADFTESEPYVYIEAALTLTLGQLLSLLIRYGIRALRVWMEHNPKQNDTEKKKEAATHD